jgi:hypothetical protein
MSTTLNRRLVLSALATSCLLVGTHGRSRAVPALPEVTAFRNPGCGCCENWAKLMEKAGFKISMSDDRDLAPKVAWHSRIRRRLPFRSGRPIHHRRTRPY